MTQIEKEINPDVPSGKDSGENVKITLSISSSVFGNITTTFKLIGWNERVDTRYIMEALKDVCWEITKKLKEVKHEDNKENEEWRNLRPRDWVVSDAPVQDDWSRYKHDSGISPTQESYVCCMGGERRNSL